MNQLEISPQPLCLVKLIEENISLVNMSADEKQIRIISRVGNHIWVNADENMLSFVFRNLLINAIKFTEGPGEIRILAATQSGQVLVKIIDSGIGIEASDLDRLFDPQQLIPLS